MKTVAKIINLLGGLNHLKCEPIKLSAPGFMDLVIEYIGTGPRDLPLVSVAHYGEQNGDLMRDPDMTFEVADAKRPGDLGTWAPITFRNDYVGIDQEAVFQDGAGRVLVRPALVRDLKSFARVWDKNLSDQGFYAAAQQLTAPPKSA